VTIGCCAAPGQWAGGGVEHDSTRILRPSVPRLSTRAPAKVNLTLHVLGRRADGYHELESLVAFAGVADELSLKPGPDLALSVEGPTAALAGEGQDNLVLKAARLLAELRRGLRFGRFRLVKRLPVAAGIGGGSSDAAAALRLLARLNGLSLHDAALREAARLTGADVTVCLEPRARMMRGIGAEVGPPLGMAPLATVLIHPGVPLETPRVFGELGLKPGEMLPGRAHPASLAPGEIVDALRSARNDLEPAALRIEPVIGEALETLRRNSRCRLARMSGSGATVFGLFANRAAAGKAAEVIARARPDWWVKATNLR
jgi:4-diphosphocytidyl-2-C-methyl-D-erythritol kinase